MRKKIALYLSAEPSDGGKYQYTLSVLKAIENADLNMYNLYAVYLQKHWEEKLSPGFEKAQLRPNNIIVKIFKKLLFTLLPNLGRDLWRILGKYIDSNHKTFFDIKPDLIVYPGKDPFIHEIDLPGIIPIFDLMHRYENFPELNEGNIYSDRETYYKRLCKYAKAIIVDSNVGKEHVLECYKADGNKIFVLPYCVPPSVANLEIKSNTTLRNLTEKFIFYPAQFWQHKNHLGLLEALHILNKQDIFINCVFVGSKKNYFNQIIAKIEEYNLIEQIQVLDYVSDEEIVELYTKAVALVMPTFLGPTNIPQLEAFAFGCPVLTSSIYGIPEQVGSAALLFNPKDSHDIADKINLVYHDTNLRMSLIAEGSRLNIKYSQGNFNLKLLDIINQILYI